MKMEINTNVNKILEEAVEGEEIILEPEEGCENGEVEIIEIIEEIEDVVEDENNLQHFEDAEDAEEYTERENDDHILDQTNSLSKNQSTSSFYNEKQVAYTSSPQSINQDKSNSQIHYDASADWEDEYEQEEQNNQVENIAEEPAENEEEFNTFSTYDNGVNTEEINIEDRTEASVTDVNYEKNINQENNEDEDDSQHEIVQNTENNLVYTVLGSKKQARQIGDKSNMEFVKVERYKADNLPEDGNIYYAVNNEENTYVQAVEEDEQQYEYINEVPMEQDNEEWEESNQNPEDQEDETEQEQIFLHEDEDGQLYFKNEHGQFQPVYRTPDGNYAIAENSSDEQDSQEDANQIPEEQVETDNYVLPDIDTKQYNSRKHVNDQSHEADNDDSTVTISLIISEDEHGQKRTQVIIPTPPESKCNLCNKTFKTSLQLLKHNRLKHAREEDITTRNFPCDLCPKRFSDQNSLARHRKSHNEGRLFQCLECHKSFPTANTLRKHLALHHSDSHPLPCIYCGRRFSDKSSLMNHEQSHLAAEKKPYICDICEKCFTNNTDLSIHKKNHDPDRKFDCEVCGREFNRLNNLQRHMMVHQQQGENEEILSCNVCGITYKFSSSLTRHMVTTHMNPEKLRQQAEEQRRKRNNHYRRYLENRKTYETQHPKHTYRGSTGRLMDDSDDDAD